MHSQLMNPSGRYIRITAEEARNTWGDGYTEFWDEQRGGYVAGLVNLPCMTSTMLRAIDLIYSIHYTAS
jgi:hypothetical protein